MEQNTDIKEKIEYIIKAFTDSNYYFEKYIIQTIKCRQIAYEILQKSSFYFHINERDNHVNIVYDEIKYNFNNNNITLDEIKNIKKIIFLTNNEKLNNSYSKFLNFLNNIENDIINQDYISYLNSQITLKFNINEENNNDSLYKIDCNYIFKENKYKDDNILNINDIVNARGYQSLLDKIKNDNNCNLNDKYNYQLIKPLEILSEHKRQAELIQEISNGDLISVGICGELFLYNLNDNTYNIKKIINLERKNNPENEKIYPTEWIVNLKETTRNFKTNNKNKKEKEKKGKKEKKEQNTINLISCSKLGIKLISPYKKINKYKEIFSGINNCSFFFDLQNNNYLYGGEEGIKYITYNDEEPKIQILKEIKGAYRGAIKISEDKYVFSSNSILPNEGKDTLTIYDVKEKNINKEINNYSFTISSNSLSIMKNIENNSSFLLCGCKKYKKNQKNGILLVELDSETYEEEFYDTDDFEVFCFCPISLFDKQNGKELIPTNYFFVGGFEKEGLIKLYKILVKEENEKKIKNEIEFIQDIKIDNYIIKKNYVIKYSEKEKIKIDNESTNENNTNSINISEKTTDDKNKKKGEKKVIDKNEVSYTKINYSFNGFIRTISCIIQSKITAKILITSWDGKVYLFSSPNIDYYLNCDNDHL